MWISETPKPLKMHENTLLRDEGHCSSGIQTLFHRIAANLRALHLPTAPSGRARKLVIPASEYLCRWLSSAYDAPLPSLHLLLAVPLHCHVPYMPPCMRNMHIDRMYARTNALHLRNGVSVFLILLKVLHLQFQYISHVKNRAVCVTMQSGDVWSRPLFPHMECTAGRTCPSRLRSDLKQPCNLNTQEHLQVNPALHAPERVFALCAQSPESHRLPC